MSNRLSVLSLRKCVIVVAACATAACAGGTPTSPSRQSAEIDAVALSSNAAVHASARPQQGTAGTVFAANADGLGTPGFTPVVFNGVWTRRVDLNGGIIGPNYEPGTCNPGVDMSLGFPTFCVVFGDGPGQFTRARKGGTAFTTCVCSLAGIGNPGDQFTLKISYPPATPPQYPFGFTKFTFQDGTGALAGLRGQGTLNFAANPAVTFSYHFVGN